MAHTKSAKKKINQYRNQRLSNNAAKSLIKTNGRKLDAAVQTKDSDAIKKAFSALCSSLDKAAKKGSITKQTAIRRKARAASRLRSLASA
ncbi:MAG TPA: 30S ribosomal protein S20 [Kiritimatiellia bacterium]|nr:30S ribosomal protein S20 [Kiritimatiellia bacterium]